MLTIKSVTASGSADLGTVTISGTIVTGPGDGQNAIAQVYALDADTNAWQTFNSDPAHPIALFPNMANTFSIVGPAPVGTYTKWRMVLFAVGSNFNTELPWQPVTPSPQLIPPPAGNAGFYGPDLGLVVTTTQIRITTPTLLLDQDNALIPGPDGKINIPYEVRIPAGPWTGPEAQGTGAVDTYVLIKGTAGWGQPFIRGTQFTPGGDPLDNYLSFKGVSHITMPSTPGLYNLQGAVYNSGWKQISGWVWPGAMIPVGQWVVKVDPATYPDIKAAFGPTGKAGVSIGGNFGNALASQPTPAHNSPGYFRLLASLGMKWMRANYDPDKYWAYHWYADLVDSVVQNILSAGMIPVIAPQDMPGGATLTDREDALGKLLVLVANRYAGVPVVIDILNEPHRYPTWEAWRPTAAMLCGAIRSVQPSTVILCPFEGFQGDGRGCAANPLPAGTADFMGWHSYGQDPTTFAARVAGLPNVLMSEHHYLDPVKLEAARASGIVGMAGWAWTTLGQDSMPLVDSLSGAVMALTDAGASLNNWQQAVINGTALPTPSVAPGSPPTPVPAVGGLTLGDVNTAIATALAPVNTAVEALEAGVALIPKLPAPPTGLTATVPVKGSVALAWTPTPGTASTVFRSTSATIGFTIIKQGIVGGTFTDTGRTPGKTYYYYVAAEGGALGRSAASTVVSATP